MAKAKSKEPTERKNLSIILKREVLTEAGYRCAVPTCRFILALDYHHIYQVSDGGKDDLDNLIALCPNCHRLYHTGVIHKESIAVYKSILISLSRAFDQEAVDCLLFLASSRNGSSPLITGDTVMKYGRLVSAGLVKYNTHFDEVDSLYSISLTDKGKRLVEAWQSGDREALRAALGVLPQQEE